MRNLLMIIFILHLVSCKSQEAKMENVPVDIEGQSENEFVNGAQKTHKEMYHDVLFEKIEILNVGEIQKCNHQFQCLISIKSYQKINNENSSFTTTMVAMSDDGIKWIFVHGDIEGLKIRYPDICL